MTSAVLGIAPSPVNPPFSDRLILAIENALRNVWGSLSAKPQFKLQLQRESEVRITALLQKELDRLRRAGTAIGYDTTTFESSPRGGEVFNYNRSKDSKRPDLTFKVCGTRSGVGDAFEDAYYIECKIIARKGRPGTREYVQEGVKRFVVGDYAWAMPHAGMLAYHRGKQILPDILDKYFSRSPNRKKYKLTGKIFRCALSTQKPSVFISEHKREFKVSNHGLPGPIKIRHMWLPT